MTATLPLDKGKAIDKMLKKRGVMGVRICSDCGTPKDMPQATIDRIGTPSRCAPCSRKMHQFRISPRRMDQRP